jgi:hypothetical protein
VLKIFFRDVIVPTSVRQLGLDVKKYGYKQDGDDAQQNQNKYHDFLHDSLLDNSMKHLYHKSIDDTSVSAK